MRHALRESERRFSAAFHANPVSMIIVSESDNKLMVVNEAFLSFTGYEREEVLYRPAIEIDLWFDTDLFDGIKGRLSAGKPARRIETQLRTKSGELRYVLVAATALDEGDTASILLVLRDITNQRRAEEALRRSEEIFARVFRSTPHLVTITTLADGIFVDVNEAFERTTGYSRREIVGRRAVEMKVWDSENERRAFVAALAEHGRVRDMDVRWRIRSGETRLGRVSAEMIEVNSEPCIISVIQDVTERNKAEVALRQSEEMFATAFHSSPHLVAITSLESGELIDVNEGFERFSGYTRDEVIGRRTVDLNLWGQPELRDHFIDRLRSEGRVQDMESRLRTRDGEERIGLISATPINVKGEDCIITVVQDITRRKKTEEALKDYAQRLQTLRDIDSAILASDSVNAIVEGATRHLFKLPGCIHVGCYIREVTGDRIRRAGGHTRKEYTPEYMEVADHESVLGPVLGGHSLIVKDAKRAQAELAPTSADLIDEVGMGSFFMVPLTVKSQHIGALGVVFEQPNAFDETHVDLAREIANPVAVAIERTRLQEELYRSNERLTTLSHKLVEAQESERHYLAHELHDHIGQMLTAAKLSMQQARDLAEEASLVDALDQHIKIMGDTLEQVRSLSLDLRPSLLDDFGLVPALKWLLDRTTVKDEFELALHADPGMARLPSDLEVTCFRVAQEAISNASRHAEATRVDVNLERRPDRVILTIADDGCGFDVDEAYAHASAGRSLGLLSMSERVRLALHSVAGEGTVLSVELPILQDSSDHS